MQYKIVAEKEISEEAWWDYIDSHPNATLFHSPFMHYAYSDLKKIEPFSLFALDQDGKIKGVLNGFIQRLIPVMPGLLSQRCVIMQSPLYDSSEVLSSLLKGFQRRFKHSILYTEIRSHTGSDGFEPILTNCGFTKQDHLNILVDLTQTEDELWKQIHSKRRNLIRKAQKNGVEVRIIAPEDLENAYNILVEVYQRAKLPLFDFDFFKKCQTMSEINHGLVVYAAYAEGQIIGTMFTYQYKKTVFDAYAGALSAYYHLNPNDVIPWMVFMNAKEKGLELFDFGGAGKPDVPYGVRDYKMQFGGELVNHGRYYYAQYPFLYNAFNKAFELRNKLLRSGK